MRVSPRAALIVTLLAALLGLVCAARAQDSPEARLGRMAKALPWGVVAKAGALQQAGFIIEALVLPPDRQMRSPASRTQPTLAARVELFAARRLRLPQFGATLRALKASARARMGSLHFNAPFALPTSAWAADGRDWFKGDFALPQSARAFLLVHPAAVAKIYATLWRDSFRDAERRPSRS